MTPLRAQTVLERTGNTLPEFLDFLFSYIPKNIDLRHIVDGLGEQLAGSQKDWVRDHLRGDLMAQLQSRLE